MLDRTYSTIVILLCCVLAGCQTTGFATGRKNSAPDQTGEPQSQTASSENISGVNGEAPSGERLDKGDGLRAWRAQQTAFAQPRGGLPIAWHNPDTGHFGQVVAGPGYSINNRQCRDYIHTLTVDGTKRSEMGVACRQNDGVWQIIPS